MDNSALASFFDAPQMARFLFGAEIADYLKEIQSHAIDMQMHQSLMKSLDREEQQDSVKQKYVELKWMTAQLPIVFEKFEPYLGFEKHK